MQSTSAHGSPPRRRCPGVARGLHAYRASTRRSHPSEFSHSCSRCLNLVTRVNWNSPAVGGCGPPDSSPEPECCGANRLPERNPDRRGSIPPLKLEPQRNHGHSGEAEQKALRLQGFPVAGPDMSPKQKTMAAPIRTPRGSWVEEGLRALGVGGPGAVRVEK